MKLPSQWILVVCIKQILSVYCIPYRWFLNINCYPINFILFLKNEGQDNAMILLCSTHHKVAVSSKQSSEVRSCASF